MLIGITRRKRHQPRCRFRVRGHFIQILHQLIQRLTVEVDLIPITTSELFRKIWIVAEVFPHRRITADIFQQRQITAEVFNTQIKTDIFQQRQIPAEVSSQILLAQVTTVTREQSSLSLFQKCREQQGMKGLTLTVCSTIFNTEFQLL